MLVLSRKEAQRIRLGDSIVITVVRLSGDKVRLGIQAPKEMLVLRDELEPLEAATRPAGATCVSNSTDAACTDECKHLARSA